MLEGLPVWALLFPVCVVEQNRPERKSDGRVADAVPTTFLQRRSLTRASNQHCFLLQNARVFVDQLNHGLDCSVIFGA